MRPARIVSSRFSRLRAFPAVLRVVIGSILLVSGCFAQSIPFAPPYPKTLNECQAFSNEVDAYESSYTQQHEECLAQHPSDRDEPPQSPICSRTTCQFLHDRLFDQYSPFSVSSLRREVRACNDAASRYLEEKSKDDEEHAKRDQARERGASERVARQRARDIQERSHSPNRPASDSEQDDRVDSLRFAQQQAGAGPYAENLANANTAPRFTPSITGPQFQSADNAQEYFEVGDPWGKSDTSSMQPLDRSPRPTLEPADPFPAATVNIANPFPGSYRTNSEQHREDTQHALFEATATVIEASTEKLLHVLDQDIQGVKDQVGKTISQSRASQLIAEIQDTRSVLHGLSWLLSSAQYTLLVKNIVTAEGPGKRDEATGEAIKQIAKEVIRQDAVKDGMTQVTLRLFGQQVGQLLVRAATPTFAVGGILLDSKKISRDNAELIHDTTGKVSLAEKQAALAAEWRGYERVMEQTHNVGNPTLQRALWIDSNIVYNECLNGKVSSDNCSSNARNIK